MPASFPGPHACHACGTEEASAIDWAAVAPSWHAPYPKLRGKEDPRPSSVQPLASLMYWASGFRTRCLNVGNSEGLLAHSAHIGWRGDAWAGGGLHDGAGVVGMMPRHRAVAGGGGGVGLGRCFWTGERSARPCAREKAAAPRWDGCFPLETLCSVAVKSSRRRCCRSRMPRSRAPCSCVRSWGRPRVR